MFAPTSTRSGACWSARGFIGTACRSAASNSRAAAADSPTWCDCALSHGTTSISRVPPPKTGIERAAGVGERLAVPRHTARRWR